MLIKQRHWYFIFFINFNYLIGTNTSHSIWFYHLHNSHLLFLFCFSQRIANTPQVTVPSNCSISKHKQFAYLITRAFVRVHVRSCTLLHGYFLSLRQVDQLQRQLAHDRLVLSRPGTMQGVGILASWIKATLKRYWNLSIESFDFPDGKHIFMASLLALN